MAVRKTWAWKSGVFLIGQHAQLESDSKVEALRNEDAKFGDIVEGDFIDTYYNLTLKLMMGMRWAVSHCNEANFYFFVDDDFFVSPKNTKGTLNTFGGPDKELYSGYVMRNSAPMRHKISKWYITLEEYPYHLWPPYVSGGALIVSRKTLQDFYYASYFVKRFKFDDIFLSFVAKKLRIAPTHWDNLYFYRPNDSVLNKAIASHGFSDSEELKVIYERQKKLRNV